MTKKPDKDKIQGVKSTKGTKEVEETAGVSGVGAIKAATGIGAVTGAGAIGKRRSTRVMSLEEREQLFQMINEEADKLFKNSPISPKHRDVVEKAVRMAVDSGLRVDDEDDDSDKKKGEKK